MRGPEDRLAEPPPEFRVALDIVARRIDILRRNFRRDLGSAGAEFQEHFRAGLVAVKNHRVGGQLEIMRAQRSGFRVRMTTNQYQ